LHHLLPTETFIRKAEAIFAKLNTPDLTQAKRDRERVEQALAQQKGQAQTEGGC